VGLKSEYDPAPFAEERHRSKDNELCSVNNSFGLECIIDVRRTYALV
jgi:hypothetical protein